jgi:uncharacterized membrane protein
VAGIFFAFSNFVMKSLGRLPPAQGIAAMQNINVDVINGGFMLAFMGTALCCLAVAISCFFAWNKPGSPYLLAGSLFYLVGTILVTMVFNVPLINALCGRRPNEHWRHPGLEPVSQELGPLESCPDHRGPRCHSLFWLHLDSLGYKL